MNEDQFWRSHYTRWISEAVEERRLRLRISRLRMLEECWSWQGSPAIRERALAAGAGD